ncbi:MAG: cytidine deaminase [Flavobacteriaceae bacterium]|nr:cytidine deaminase [Flavobacteriaceae bacterium]
MHKKKVTFDLEIYDSQEELAVLDQELMRTAVLARENAYAPYSGFQVGAAVLLANGEIVIGNNQENASYPSGLCAERVAIFHAGARFPGIAVKAIAISVNSVRREVDTPAAPCGNCRQAIAEYEQRQDDGIEILMMGASGEVYKSSSIADLLPLAFGKSYLD